MLRRCSLANARGVREGAAVRRWARVRGRTAVVLGLLLVLAAPQCSCSTCLAGQYWNVWLQACQDCPANADSPAGSLDIADCTCRPGNVRALQRTCSRAAVARPDHFPPRGRLHAPRLLVVGGQCAVEAGRRHSVQPPVGGEVCARQCDSILPAVPARIHPTQPIAIIFPFNLESSAVLQRAAALACR